MVASLAGSSLCFDPRRLGRFSGRLQYFFDRRPTDLAQTGMSGGEELRLTTADGETLVAWHFPAKDGRPLILYFHGNAGALVDRVPRFRMFTASGNGVLAVSYRGYGGSTGSPTESGLMQDGETAYREARARGYDDDRIILMAHRSGPASRSPSQRRMKRPPLFSRPLICRRWTSPPGITGFSLCVG